MYNTFFAHFSIFKIEKGDNIQVFAQRTIFVHQIYNESPFIRLQDTRQQFLPIIRILDCTIRLYDDEKINLKLRGHRSTV